MAKRRDARFFQIILVLLDLLSRIDIYLDPINTHLVIACCDQTTIVRALDILMKRAMAKTRA